MNGERGSREVPSLFFTNQGLFKQTLILGRPSVMMNEIWVPFIDNMSRVQRLSNGNQVKW